MNYVHIFLLPSFCPFPFYLEKLCDIYQREREGEECDSYGAHLFWWLVYRQAKQVGREKSMDIYDPFKKEKEKSSMDIMLFSRRFNEY